VYELGTLSITRLLRRFVRGAIALPLGQGQPRQPWPALYHRAVEKARNVQIILTIGVVVATSTAMSLIA
jgi:hypothetical protein